jgi:Holliday junction resolvase RusA-like endonuclease
MTINQAYPANAQGRRFLCPKGKEYKKAISLATTNSILAQEFIPDSKFYKLSVAIKLTDFYTKDNRVSKKRPDASNTIKLIEDAVCEMVGIDDNLVIHPSAYIHPQNFEKDSIEITLDKIR